MVVVTVDRVTVGAVAAAAVSFSGSRSAGTKTAASRPSAAARAATAPARLPVEEHESVSRPSSCALRGRDRDDAILERVRRVRGVELQPELADAELLGEPRRGHERREARREPGLVRRRDGEQVGVAPDRRRAGLDPLAGHRPAQGVPVVDRVERPEAAGAAAGGLERVLGGTDSTGRETADTGGTSFARSTHPSGFGTGPSPRGLPRLTGPVPQPLSMWSGTDPAPSHSSLPGRTAQTADHASDACSTSDLDTHRARSRGDSLRTPAAPIARFSTRSGFCTATRCRDVAERELWRPVERLGCRI